MAQLSTILRPATERSRRYATIALLAAVIALGGSSAAHQEAHLLLQLGAIVVLGVCATAPRLLAVPRVAYRYLALAAAFVAIALIQLMPLPGFLRRLFQGGSEIETGFRLTGLDMPAMPMSMDPFQTYLAMFGILVPLALFILILKLSWKTATDKIIWGVPIVGVVSAALGIAQMVTGWHEISYLYDVVDRGRATGVFANVDHQATFLLMCLPICAVMGSRIQFTADVGDGRFALGLFGVAVAAFICAGILITFSIFAYFLFVPVLALSVLIFRQKRKQIDQSWKWVVPGSLVLGFAFAVFFALPVLGALGLRDVPQSESLQLAGIWSTSLNALRDYWFFGAGLGAFPDVFALYEQPDALTNVYVNHAQNDYLEWVIEVGVVGVLLIAAAFILLADATVKVWRPKLGSGSDIRLKRAASISMWVPFLMSFFDYPLRTPAIAAFTAVCLAVVIAPHSRRAPAQARRRESSSSRRSGSISGEVEI